MKHSIVTYCSKDFLNNFIGTDRIKLNDAEEACYVATKRLLKQESHLKLEPGIFSSRHPSIEKFKEDIFTTKGSTAEFCYHFDEIINSDDEYINRNIDPCSVHLHNGNKHFDQCNLLLAQADNWLQKLKYINKRAEEYSVSGNPSNHDFPGWNYFKETSKNYPVNSLVISNNYLLNESKTFDKNILKIIEALMPIHINSEFHLTITYSSNGDKATEENNFHRINSFITNFRKDYDIKFNLFSLHPTKIHPRLILSNYYNIEIDHNFDFYDANENIKYDAWLKFIPLNGIAGNKHYTKRKKIAEEIKKEKNYRSRYGWEGINRLLKF